MAKILSNDEIDALLSSVAGKSDEDSLDEETQKVTAYDFKNPNLVSKEQLRILETIHEGFCRNLGVYLSSQLKMIVEMNLLAIDQISYSEFVMSIAPPSSIYVTSIDKPKSQIVLELNPQLAVFIVERLFGGRGGFISEIRPLSIIEQKIMIRVIDKIAQEISKNFSLVSEFTCIVERYESNPEFVQIIPSLEPVVVVSIETKIQGNSTLMNICYPYMWISNIISGPDVREKMIFGVRELSDVEKNIMKENLYNTPINLKAVLGKSRITIGDFMNLSESDIIKLDTRTDSPLQLWLNNRHISNASVGIYKQKYACRINSLFYGKKDYEF